jgi:hypothetical protein
MMQLEGGREARSPLNPKPYTLNKATSKEQATRRNRRSKDDDGSYTFTKQRHETRTLLDYYSDRRRRRSKAWRHPRPKLSHKTTVGRENYY